MMINGDGARAAACNHGLSELYLSPLRVAQGRLSVVRTTAAKTLFIKRPARGFARTAKSKFGSGLFCCLTSTSPGLISVHLPELRGKSTTSPHKYKLSCCVIMLQTLPSPGLPSRFVTDHIASGVLLDSSSSVWLCQIYAPRPDVINPCTQGPNGSGVSGEYTVAHGPTSQGIQLLFQEAKHTFSTGQNCVQINAWCKCADLQSSSCLLQARKSTHCRSRQPVKTSAVFDYCSTARGNTVSPAFASTIA